MADLLLTYLLRSSILLAFTFLLVQLPGLGRAAARDVLLKVALLASFFSPFLPTGLLPTIRLESLPTPLSTSFPKHPESEAIADALSTSPLLTANHDEQINQRNDLAILLDWSFVAFLLLIIGAMATLVQFGRAWWLLRKILARAKPITKDFQRELAVDARVRILSTQKLASPVAFGRQTILVPEPLWAHFDKQQMQTVLAHEVTHLHRRDPLWNTALSILSYFCFFQPLNFLALHLWRHASEELCDAEAVKITRDPLILARCLLEITRYQSNSSNILTTCIIGKTHLTKRIEALLNAKEVYMKRSYLVLLSLLPFCILLFLPFVTFAQNTNAKTVVLDAGHGGIDPGAVGYGKEAEITLSVAQKVKVLLEKQGINVVMTREDDTYVELEQRVKFADQDTDVVISLHAQIAPSPSASGIATWVHNSPDDLTFTLEDMEFTGSGETDSINGNLESAGDSDVNVDSAELTLAYNLQAELVNATGAKDRGTRENSFYILRNIQVPSIMIDMGFVSNPAEGARLATDTYQQQLAEAIAKTLAAYLE